MPFWLLQQKLTSRGYWEEAGDGTGGEGAGGSEGESSEGSSGAEDRQTTSDDSKGDGDNKPSEKEAQLLKEVMKRKAKQQELESELNALKQQASKFDGIDIDMVSKLIKDQKDAETRKLEEKGQWDALKTQMVEENKKVLTTKDAEIAALKEQLGTQQVVIDKLTLGSAFSSSQFIQSELNLSPEKTRIIYGAHFEIEGDKVVAYDKPKGSSDRVQLINGEGNPLSFDEAIRKIVEQDPDKNLLVKPKQKQGAGSSTSNMKPQNQQPQIRGIGKIQAALEAGNK